MSSIFEHAKRTIVPRWRDYETTSLLGELDHPRVQDDRRNNPINLEQLVRDWRRNGTLFHATDLVSCAFVASAPELAQDAAGFILRSPQSSPLAREVAQQVVDGVSRGQPLPPLVWQQNYFRQQIRALRRRLKDEPRNAILRVEMARAYTVLGLKGQAERLIETAVALGPQNRFVLRSASRFFLHTGQKDRAHRILFRSGRLTEDPWLLAAEIAVADLTKTSSRLIKTGIRIFENADIPYFHKSELACMLGMQEYSYGAIKKARKFFRESLIQPTENAVAQVVHISEIENNEQLIENEGIFRIPRSFESLAHRDFLRGEWQSAERNAIDWCHDQPFSSRAARWASYLLLVIHDLEQSDKAYDLLECALLHDRADRDSDDGTAVALNNMAYILARKGQTEEAEKQLRQIDIANVSDEIRLTTQATEAIIHYRNGLALLGHQLYKQAIEGMQRMRVDGDKRAAIALINFAREEMLARTLTAEEVYQRAIEAATKVNKPDIELMKQTLQKHYVTYTTGQRTIR